MTESCVSSLFCCHNDGDRAPEIIEVRNGSLLAESPSRSGWEVISVI